MSKVFDIHVLPAQRGDSLWIEYGPAASPHRIIIDGGITKTGREHLKDRLLAAGDRVTIDLLVVTHIDLDHIQGVIKLLQELPPGVMIERVWFNGFDQLPLEAQGVNQGIELSTLLEQAHAAAWNRDVGGAAIGITAGAGLPAFLLPGDMKITVLSPDHDQLVALKLEWQSVIEEFGAAEQADAPDDPDIDAIAGLETMGAEEIDVPVLAKSQFVEDKAVPNGSSIALLLEFGGKSALMLGDAHPTRVLKSLTLLSPNAALEVDCVKLSHHGSKKNTSRALAAQLRSPRWIFSSNGAMTKHPNAEAVARVLHDSPGRKSLTFNYRTKFNEMWDNTTLQVQHDYEANYGDGESAVVVKLL